MTDISMISAIYGGIQQGLSTAQAILQMKTSAEVSLKVSEVIDRLHSTQLHVDTLRDRLAAVEERNQQLEKELARFNQFAIDKEGYLQVAIGPDAFVYMQENDVTKGATDTPKVCANCYQHSKIRPLQFTRYEGNFKVLVCNECKQEVKSPHGIKQEFLSVPRRDRGF